MVIIFKPCVQHVPVSVFFLYFWGTLDGSKHLKSYYCYYYWLVVSTLLKNISQLGVLLPIYGKIKHVPKHQPALSLPYDLGDNHPLSSYDCPGIIRVSHLCRSGRFEGSYFPAAQLGWKQLRNTLEMEII